MPLTKAEKQEAYELLHERGIFALDLALVEIEDTGETSADAEIISAHIDCGNLTELDRDGNIHLTARGSRKAQAARPYRNVLAELVGA